MHFQKIHNSFRIYHLRTLNAQICVANCEADMKFFLPDFWKYWSSIHVREKKSDKSLASVEQKPLWRLYEYAYFNS